MSRTTVKMAASPYAARTPLARRQHRRIAPVPGHRPQHRHVSLLRLAGCENITRGIEYLSGAWAR